jgi:Hint domain
VRIAAGGSQPNVPVRDHWLSRDHAVLVEDLPVAVKSLINGTSIVKKERECIEYHHVRPARDDIYSSGVLPRRPGRPPGLPEAHISGKISKINNTSRRKHWHRRGCITSPTSWERSRGEAPRVRRQ